MTPFKEGDVVVLKTDLPDEGLSQGMLGTIVVRFTQPTLAYETEFVDDDGRTIAQIALMPDQIGSYEVGAAKASRAGQRTS